MKIGFLGNTNNYPFALARAFKKMGHDVLVIINQTYNLHRPENRYPDITLPYPPWIVDVTPIDDSEYVIPNPKRTLMIEQLKQCDLLFLNHLGPSLLPFIERPAIVIFTGSDLDYYADYKSMNTFYCNIEATGLLEKSELVKQLGKKLATQQRNGIQSAQWIRYFPKGAMPHGDALLKEIGISDEKRIHFDVSEVDCMPFTPQPHNTPIRTFCATRLNWKKPIPPGFTELDYKGSDIMIRGLAQFYRETQTRLDIQLVKKGLHVKETMDLIEENGLTDQVTWSEEMIQTEIMQQFRKADIIFEQFGDSLIGMAGLDAMMTGRPVIAHAKKECFVFSESNPVCQAANPEEVSAQLKRLVFNPEERERVGKVSHDFMEKYYSPEAAAKLCLSKLQI